MPHSADQDRRSRSTTAPTLPSEPRTPVSPSASASTVQAHASGRRPQPLPNVKGTMGGIESPRRDFFSPAPTVHPSPAPSRARSVTASVDADADADAADAALTQNGPEPPAPILVFRADPRMVTCFDGLPEGADEIKAKFGVA